MNAPGRIYDLRFPRGGAQPRRAGPHEEAPGLVRVHSRSKGDTEATAFPVFSAA